MHRCLPHSPLASSFQFHARPLRILLFFVLPLLTAASAYATEVANNNLLDPSFEDGTDWYVVANSSDGQGANLNRSDGNTHQGAYLCAFYGNYSSGGAGTIIGQDSIAVESGQEHTLTFWIRTGFTKTSALTARAYESGGALISETELSISTANQWTKGTLVFTPTSSAIDFRLQETTPDSSSNDLYLDDLALTYVLPAAEQEENTNLQSPSFETSTGWYVVENSSDGGGANVSKTYGSPHDGAHVCAFYGNYSSGGDGAIVGQDGIAVDAGAEHTLTYWIRSEYTKTSSITARAYQPDGTLIAETELSVSTANQWSSLSLMFTPETEFIDLRFQETSTDSSINNVFLDDVSLMYVPSPGVNTNLQSPSFESSAGWYVVKNSSDGKGANPNRSYGSAHDGSHVCAFYANYSSGANGTVIGQDSVGVIPYREHTLTFWGRSEYAKTTAVTARVYESGGGLLAETELTVSTANQWASLSLVFTPTTDCVDLRFQETSSDSSTNDCYLDDISLTYGGRQGTPLSIAMGQPGITSLQYDGHQYVPDADLGGAGSGTATFRRTDGSAYNFDFGYNKQGTVSINGSKAIYDHGSLKLELDYATDGDRLTISGDLLNRESSDTLELMKFNLWMLQFPADTTGGTVGQDPGAPFNGYCEVYTDANPPTIRWNWGGTRDGVKVAKFFGNYSSGGNGAVIGQDNIGVVAGAKHTLTAWALSEFAKDSAITARVYSSGGALIAEQQADVNIRDEWTCVSVTFTPTTSSIKLRFQETSADSSSNNLFLDDVGLTYGADPRQVNTNLQNPSFESATGWYVVANSSDGAGATLSGDYGGTSNLAASLLYSSCTPNKLQRMQIVDGDGGNKGIKHMPLFYLEELGPGQSRSFNLEFQFGNGYESYTDLVPDVISAYRQAYASTIQNWTDRRMITYSRIAPGADSYNSGKNPNKYLLPSESVDVTTTAGLEDFRTKLLNWGQQIVDCAIDYDAQGVIIWDLEGFDPGPRFYGDPRVLPDKCPELEYKGSHALSTVDALFKLFDDAGLRHGYTIRPQRLHVDVGSGGKVMMATPDDEVKSKDDTDYTENYVGNSPRLDWNVNFTHSGTHYVWVRGRDCIQSDMVNIGLNNTANSTADHISGYAGSGFELGWSNDTWSSGRATLEISSTGVQQLNAWMGRDGAVIDKIVITTDPNYTPSGEGPAESSVSGGAFQQNSGGQGILSIEAEHFHGNVSYDKYAWEEVDGDWAQDYSLTLAEQRDELDDIISYGKQRWGSTLFYIDSNSDISKRTKYLRSLTQIHPDTLIIPEWEEMNAYLVSAPLNDYPESVEPYVREWIPAAIDAIFSAWEESTGLPNGTYSDAINQAVSYGSILVPIGWFVDQDLIDCMNQHGQ